MNELLNDILMLLGALAIIYASKYLIPKESYEMRLSLIISIIVGLYFALDILLNFSILSLLSFLICSYYVYSGGIELKLKTATLVFSTITKQQVGRLEAGTHWIDPLFEVATISVDGIPNKTIDLQELEIDILETKLMQTFTKGIQAKVKEISFMLELHGDATRLLEIEGGSNTVKKRIIKFIDEFFMTEIAKILPGDLDQNKHKVIQDLVRDLKKDVNAFCEKNTNRYPYRIADDVIIGDTELEPKYYEVLARAEFAKLEQAGKDVEAKALRERVSDFGKHILPGRPETEQIEKALISLGITKENTEKKQYSVDPILAQLAKDIAMYFKK